MNLKVLPKGLDKLQGYKEIDSRELIGKGRDKGKHRGPNIRTTNKEMKGNQ